jgi:two-component sensor histidine kinase
MALSISGARLGAALNQKQSVARSKSKTHRTAGSSTGEGRLDNVLDAFPCVLYECTVAFEITYISPNLLELIGVNTHDFQGSRAHWEKKIPNEDLHALNDAIAQFQATGTGSAIHRIVNDAGVPVWVCHSFRSGVANRTRAIRGCIVPLPRERRLQALDPGIIARFVHKIGNHFQVLSLVISGLKRSLADPRPTEMLEGALDKAVDLTRAFSEFAQGCSWPSRVDLATVLGSVVLNKKPLFADRGVELQERIDASLQGVTLPGDAYLMELALNSILQNALEVSKANDHIDLEASADALGGRQSVIRIRVSDNGGGIPRDKIDQILLPFYSSKPDHEGLGLSMAARFIEMHGGRLQVRSVEGRGTTVEITLSGSPASAVSAY